MMHKFFLFLATLFALAACEQSTIAPTSPEKTLADAAAQPIKGDAASAWIEMTGVWAPEGQCGDTTHEWRLEPEAFHRHEMHCAISRLELLQNGVRVIAHCSVEGDDDRVEDAFKFIRRADYTLSIVSEANGAETDGLAPCDVDMTP